MRSNLLQAFLVVLGLVGCSSSASRSHAGSGQDRLDVLTSFSLALSKYDFQEAARYLAPADRAKLAGPQEGILPEYRERVRAIRRTTLLNNPLIEVRDGLIYGIPDVLPVLTLGRADTLDLHDAPDSQVAVRPDSSKIADAKKEELRRASEEFFRAVSRRDWSKAMACLDVHERGDFLDAKGKVKEEARQRLAAVDTTSWQALTLKNGKLTGVVLIIPDNAAKNRIY